MTCMELIVNLRDTHNFATSTTNNIKINSYKFGNRMIKIMGPFAVNVITRTKNKQ